MELKTAFLVFIFSEIAALNVYDNVDNLGIKRVPKRGQNFISKSLLKLCRISL